MYWTGLTRENEKTGSREVSPVHRNYYSTQIIRTPRGPPFQPLLSV